MRVEFAAIGGVRTRLYRGGEGPPVLLLHGVGASADIWLNNLDALARGFTVYAPDMLDNGFTEPGAYRGGAPQPFMLDHLEALLDHYGIDDVAVIGSSFGGLLAALLYFRRPERVGKLILISSGTCFNSDEELARTLRESYANGRTAIAQPSIETCRQRMRNVVFDPASVPEALVLMQLTLYALPNALPAYDRRMHALMDVASWQAHRITGRLRDVHAPTLLVWGQNDPRVVLARAEAAAREIPNARLALFERCKHFPQLEHPDRFNRLAMRFLNGETITESAA